MRRQQSVRQRLLISFALVGIVLAVAAATQLADAALPSAPTTAPQVTLTAPSAFSGNLVVPGPGYASPVPSVACPTVSLCVGLAESTCPPHRQSCSLTCLQPYVVTKDPAHGATWTVPHGCHGPSGPMACPSANLCLAFESEHSPSPNMNTLRIVASQDVERSSSYTPVTGDITNSYDLNGSGPGAAMTCPSEGLCAALSYPYTLYSNAPARPGSWHHRPFPPAPDYVGDVDHGLTCTSSGLCMAYNNFADTSHIAIIPNVTDPVHGWQRLDVDPEDFSQSVDGGSCVRLPKSTDTSCLGEQLTGGACVAPSDCLVTTDYGAAIASTDPAGGASTWSRTQIYGHAGAPRDDFNVAEPVCLDHAVLCRRLQRHARITSQRSPHLNQPILTKRSAMASGSDPASRFPQPRMRQSSDLLRVRRSKRELPRPGGQSDHHAVSGSSQSARWLGSQARTATRVP